MKDILFVSLFILCSYSYSQHENNQDNYNFQLTKLNENVYIHTYDNSNGIIYLNNNEAIIVSTPPSDEVTKELINYVENEFKANIIGYIIDRWHPDAMEGLDIVHEYEIESYANILTCLIAEEKGLPVPKNCFEDKLELKVGNNKIVCQYFGPAHTEDGIVVWIPEEKVLFGGNEVRNFNGWVGNISDATLSKWSNTIENVKTEYGLAKFVVPGHGRHGGPELLDYTIKLYTSNKWIEILKKHQIPAKKVMQEYDKIFIAADSDSSENDIVWFKKAIVFVDKNDQYVMIQADLIEYNKSTKTLRSDYGKIQILNRQPDSLKEEVYGYYKTLILDLREDEVEMVIAIREMIR